MISVSERRKILETTAGLWRKVHEIEVDIVDGTFYWGVCRGDEIEEIRNSYDRDSGMPPDYVDSRLRTLIPSYDAAFDWTKIPMRSAATGIVHMFSHGKPNLMGGWAEGEDLPYHVYELIQIDVRNQEWRGVDVEAAAIRAWDQQSLFNDETWRNADGSLYGRRRKLEFDHLFINCRLFRKGEYTTTVWWNEGSPDAKSEQLVYEPFIRVSTAGPLPAPGVLALHYDSHVRDQLEWHLALRGGVNGQDVSNAIKTWAAFLLFQYGMKADYARWEVQSITGQVQDKSSYHESLHRIKHRVPELNDWVSSRHVNRTGP